MGIVKTISRRNNNNFPGTSQYDIRNELNNGL